MLYYDRIDVSDCIDIHKISDLKECIICHHCYFLGKGFKTTRTRKIKQPIGFIHKMFLEKLVTFLRILD